MPKYTAQMPDGRSITLEGARPPTEAEFRAAMKAQKARIPTPSQSVDPGRQPTRADIAKQSIREAAGRILEPISTIATGMVAEPIAGIAGLVQGAGNSLAGLLPPGMAGQTSPAERVAQTRQALTAQPKTQAGQDSLKTIGDFMAPVSEAMQAAESGLGDAAFGATGSPLAAAAASTVPAALLESLALGGGRAVRGARGVSERPLISESGQPSPEMTIALRRAGISIDELPPGAVNALRTFTTARRPEDALRAAQFEQAGVSPMRSNITQDFAQSAQEQRLLATTDPRSDAVRRRALKQSKEFETSARGEAEAAGDADLAGASVKGALTGRQKALNKEKRRAYKQYAETNPEVSAMPLDSKAIRESLLPDDVLDDLAIQAGEGMIERLDSLLVKYGINADPDAVAAFLKGKTRNKANKITQLTVGNLDSFRKAVNGLARESKSDALKVATGPILRALDGEVDLVKESLQAGGVDTSAIDSLKRARSLHTQVKTEFNDKAITGQLVSFKKNSTVPTVENSQAAKKVLTGPIENLDRVTSSLLRAGDDGVRAIGNMQARVILDALENATKAGSRKIDGELVAEGRLFDDYLSKKVGDDKLEILFANNPDALAALNNLREVAKNMSAAADAKPKGSAPVLMDLMRHITRLPILGHGLDVLQVPISAVGNRALDAGRVRAAVSMTAPRRITTADDFSANWPTLAAVLGVGGVTSESQ